MKLTRAQSEALANVYRRPLDSEVFGTYRRPKTFRGYLAFRRTVQPGFACAGEQPTAMVHWAGMWLGIEPDGYTHS